MIDETINEKKINLLFLAWGFSIHAKRRIEIFSKDPRYNVNIFSNFNYNFENANNVTIRPARLVLGKNIGNKTSTVGKKYFNFTIKLKIITKKWFLIRYYKFLKEFLKELINEYSDFNLLKKTISKNKPDIIFLQTLLFPCYLALFLNKKYPLIITFWNGDLIWQAKYNMIEEFFKERITNFGIKKAKAITVNSKSAYDICRSKGVDSNKLNYIIYPGVDTELFRSIDKNKSRKLLNLKQDEKIILWPRGLGDYINSEIFIKACSLVIKKINNLKIIILSSVGDSIELEKHKSMTEEMKINQNFLFIGQVSFEKMPYYYNVADVLVSLSSNDSLPNVMLEAMACGIPVLMSDIPQIREWIKDLYNGYLVNITNKEEIAEKIMSVLLDKFNINKIIVLRNYDLVDKNFSSKNNKELIKELVNKVYREKKV